MKNINQNRRSFIKIAALFTAVPFLDSITNRAELLASTISSFSTSLVKNGEVLTAAHWGMLKLTIKNSKVI
ncbi:hypothetical protein CP963_14275, partial [Arcobacter cloacae]